MEPAVASAKAGFYWVETMYVYRIRSTFKTHKTYIGVTDDLKRRLAEHNAGKSAHTSKFAPWSLEFYVWLEDETKAYAFERYLKSGSGRAFTKRHF